jgi:hypothetical protein
MRRALRRLWYALRQRQSDADLAEEMAVHREMAERELAQSGAAPPDARLGAERLFGSAALARDRSRDVWIPPALQDITRDVRFAVRLLTKDRGFTFAAVMTLALGIGAAGTIFTIFDGMFLHAVARARGDRRDGDARPARTARRPRRRTAVRVSMSIGEFGWIGATPYLDQPTAAHSAGGAPTSHVAG